MAPCGHSSEWGDGLAVSVLILNYNGSRFLSSCLGSVTAQACKHSEVILVDNGSTDGSAASAQREFPPIRVVAHQSNLGFGRAYNAAVNQVSGRYLVFLNNDTIVQTRWMVPLVDELIRDRGVGLTTSKVLFMGSHILQSAGGKLKLWQGGSELGFGNLESFLGDRLHVEPFFASGAAMAMPRKLFLDLGGFDPQMWLYGEDLDLCWRARLAGYTIRFVPQSVVYHHYSGTSGVFNPTKHRLVMTHYFAVMIKCLSAANLVHSLPAFTMFAIAKGIGLAIAERNTAYVANVIKSLRDTFAAWGRLKDERRETQALRVAPDRHVLKSEGFGLVDSPCAVVRSFRLGRRLKRRPELTEELRSDVIPSRH